MKEKEIREAEKSLKDLRDLLSKIPKEEIVGLIREDREAR